MDDWHNLLDQFDTSSVMAEMSVTDSYVWDLLNGSERVREVVFTELSSRVKLSFDPDNPEHPACRFLLSLDAISVTKVTRIISCCLHEKEMRKIFERDMISDICDYCGASDIFTFIHNGQFAKLEATTVSDQVSMKALEDCAEKVRSLIIAFAPDSVKTYLRCLFPPTLSNVDIEILENDRLALVQLLSIGAKLLSPDGNKSHA